MLIVKEINGLKTSMWPSWAELFAEIPELEADLRRDFKLMFMMMMMMIVCACVCVCFYMC